MRLPHPSKTSAVSVLCCVLIYATSVGQPLLISDTTTTYRIDKAVSIYIDSADTYSFDNMLSPEIQRGFSKSKGNLIFGYLKPPVWIKIETRTSSPHTSWNLEIPAPFLEYVDFYQKDSTGNWIKTESGYYRKQSARAVPHTSHFLPLYFGEDSTSTVYVKIAGSSPKTFPLYIIEKETFLQKTRLEDIGYGVFFGILIVMFFFNLMLGIMLRHMNYFLYIGTIVCTFLIFSAASGYGGRFLWPEHPQMNFYAGRMSLPLMAATLAVFTIRFLNVKAYSVTSYRILLSLVPSAVVVTFLITTGILPAAGNHLITLSTIVFLVTGIVCALMGNKTAYYFIAAWSIYLVGGLLLTLRNSGLLEFNFWTTHFVEIGAALETIMIAFALGQQYRRYKREKEEMQVLAFKVQRDATERLEMKVRERTAQLSKALNELRHTLETNTRQTAIIEHKNAELDSFFYRISHDLKGPVTSLLGLSALAKKEVTEQKAHEYIDMQHQQVQRLNHIITGLINLAKMNHEDLKREAIDFHKLVDGCILSLNNLPNFSALTFRKEIEPGLEFFSEWILLNAIFQNLIENSIKYAQGDSPYVRVVVKQEKEWIKIEVEDNGQGIPEEHQSKIFDMFYRATQSANGTGLGLYILKRSVDRLNGSIAITSKEGIGSVFTVKLPSGLPHE